MADDELEAIRRQRMAELQSKHGVRREGHKGTKNALETEMRNSILAQVLDQSARARLSNLALVKPEKAKAVENYLIQMARMGQLGGKISETGLIDILEKVSQQTEKKTTVKVSPRIKYNITISDRLLTDCVSSSPQFNRRKVMDSDDEDDD
uniref:Programmed cell death protein 5 n=1 Tax=Hucho hucho TaxID=62062 RepID=A0A4W5M243_9TELE